MVSNQSQLNKAIYSAIGRASLSIIKRINCQKFDYVGIVIIPDKVVIFPWEGFMIKQLLL